MSTRIIALLVVVLLVVATAVGAWLFVGDERSENSGEPVAATDEQPAQPPEANGPKASRTANGEQDHTVNETEDAEQEPVPGDHGATEEAADVETTGALKGRVLDNDDEPVADVTVLWTVWWRESRRDPLDFGAERGVIRTRTDEHGRFRLGWLRTSDYEPGAAGHVVVTAPTLLEVRGKPADWGSQKPLEFTVERAPAVRVHVRSPNGEPVADAEVAALHTREPVDEALTENPRLALRIGVLSLGRERLGRTDEHGVAEIGPLREPEHATHVGAFAEGYGPGHATNLNLASRGFTDVEITLAQGEEISGRVVDQYGAPVAQCRIHVTAPGTVAQLAGEDLLAQSARTDADGDFTVRGLVPPIGAFAESGFTVEASIRGYDDETLEGVQPGEFGLLIRLHRHAVVAVEIRTPDGEPLGARELVDLWLERDGEEGGEPRPHYVARELFLADEAGQALNRKGEPDPHYEQPGTGFYGRLERELKEGERWMRRLVGIEPGTYTLVARHNAYATERASGLVIGTTESRRDVEVIFRPGASLRGTVFDANGEPLEQALIQASDFDPRVTLEEVEDLVADFRWHPTSWRRTERTGEDGTFEFTSLPAGEVHLLVGGKGHLLHERTLTLDAESTQALEIFLEPGLEIRGRIRDADGTPATGARLSVNRHREPHDYWVHGIWQHDRHRVYRRVEQDARTIEVDNDEEAGRFVVGGLAPAEYRLSASAPGADQARKVVSAGASDVEISLGALAEIAGTITLPDGSPVAQGTLVSNYDQHSLDTSRENGRFRYDAERGRFRLLVSPGEHTLVAHSDGYASVSADVLATLDAPAEVELTLGETFGLAVHVHDAAGEPVEHATVELRATGNYRYRAPELPAGQLTDSQGVARFEEIPLPVFSIRVDRDDAAPAHADVDVRTTEDVRIRLTAGGQLAGRITRTGGKPAADTEVTLRQVMTEFGSKSVRTDQSGRFRFERLSPGSYTVELNVDGIALYEVVTIHDGETTHLYRSLGEAIPVVIRTLLDGQPVAAGFSLSSQRQWTSVRTDSNGTVETVLLPGRYEAYAIRVPELAMMLEPQRFVVPSGVDAHEVTLQIPAGGIVGVLCDGEGNPRTGKWVSAVRLDAKRGSDAQATSPVMTRTASDGSFRLFGLHGTYRVFARNTYSGGSAAQAEVEVPDGETISLQLTLQEAGQVRVRMEGVPQATVDETARIDLYYADGARVPNVQFLPLEGASLLQSIFPGRYTLRVSVAGYAQQFHEVLVEAGQTSEVVVAPGETGRLHVHVLDPEGRPTQDVALTVLDEDGRDVTPSQSMISTRHLDGEENPPALEVLGLGSGTYTVKLTSYDGATASRTVDIRARETFESTLHLKK